MSGDQFTPPEDQAPQLTPLSPHAAPPPHPPHPPRKRRWGCGVWIAVIAGVCVLGVGFLFVLGLLGLAIGDSGFDATGESGLAAQLTEHTLDGRGQNKVLVIPVVGMIMDMPQRGLIRGQSGMVATIKAMLKRARADRKIKAVILLIDSPGGGITASDILYHEIKSFREETGLPVIALLGDVAASGGYYVAAGADHVIAHPTTVTGSIGVIMPLMGFKGLMEKIGVESRPIKSGKNKDIGSGSRDITPEERKMLQDIVDEYHQRFVTVVHEGFRARGVTVDRATLEGYCDGRVFTGRQAKELQFVDALGYYEDAVRKAQTRAALDPANTRIIMYAPKPSVLDLILARSSAPRAGSLTLNIEGLDRTQTPRFMYLWTVGQTLIRSE